MSSGGQNEKKNVFLKYNYNVNNNKIKEEEKKCVKKIKTDSRLKKRKIVSTEQYEISC